MLDERKQLAKENSDLYRDKPKYINKCLRINLPLPVSVNHLHQRMRNGQLRLTQRAMDYTRESRALINLAIEEQKWIKQDYAVWFYVDAVFYMPDRRVRDSHNLLKLLLDVMQGIVYDNDVFIMPRIQSVELDTENPRVEIKITPQKDKDRKFAKLLTAVEIPIFD